MLGPITLLLAYYRCERCGESQKPWDRTLGLSGRQLTPAAQQIVSQAGVLASFAEGSERTLRDMAGLHVSESTVERITEEVGKRVKQQLDAGQTQGPKQDWRWQKDAEGRTCAYVSLDHTGIRQQGPGATRADGKMAAVAMVYNPASDHDPIKPLPHQARYISGFLELDEIGRQLRREAEAVGVMRADQQIALSDGGAGLEEVFKTYFPRAVCILDFYHAKEHLVELAQSLYPADDPARQKWLDARCHQLKHAGGRAVLAHLQGMDLSGSSPTVREVHRKQASYFRNHCHRINFFAPRWRRAPIFFHQRRMASVAKRAVS